MELTLSQLRSLTQGMEFFFSGCCVLEYGCVDYLLILFVSSHHSFSLLFLELYAGLLVKCNTVYVCAIDLYSVRVSHSSIYLFTKPN